MLVAKGAHNRTALFFGAFLISITALLAAVAPVASALPTEFWGLNGNSGYQGSESDWNKIQQSGAKHFRMEVNWGVKNEKGWSHYDSIFRLAAERNITILPYLYGRGDKSHRFPTQSEYGPPGSGWETWVYEVVHRYGYSGDFWTEAGHPSNIKPVTAWEVWNEPNLRWNNPLLWDETKKEYVETVQPQNYANFLKRTASAIQASQKEKSGGGTQVLFGGLFTAATSKEGSNYVAMNVNDFLEKAASVSETGAAFVGLSLHPYSFSGGLPGVQTNVNFAREKLNKWFSSSKSLWITELGWPVEGTGQSTVNETLQAELLSSSFGWIKNESAALNIQSLAWFDYRDVPGESWDLHTGLLRQSGEERPAWCTYRDLVQVSFCNPYPVSWPNDNLGGYLTSDPSISSWESGRLDVFARGGDNALWHSWFTPGTGWSGWSTLYGSLTSGPDAVSWGKNRIDVFARTTDGSVWQAAWNGSTWSYGNIGGGIIGDPAVSSSESGRLDVFARGTDNRLYHNWYTPGTNWSGWSTLYGSLTSGPDAVSWGANRIDVVSRASDGSVWHVYWNGSVWNNDNLGGYIIGDPAISSRGSGQLEVFARGGDSRLYRKAFNSGTGWSEWETLYGSLTSSPDAVSWGSGRTDVVAQGYLGNNSLLHAWTGE